MQNELTEHEKRRIHQISRGVLAQGGGKAERSRIDQGTGNGAKVITKRLDGIGFLQPGL